ncbi:uncharacterized protein TNCV_2621791 [Trichonephila clavipes]|uniref:Uncharacterized protein n=1 Tax=Trichonephila clavipes TaxID=2585209 RepID=A0A8X7BIV6_TRICX|nr:uncharacterized protein TNCV_2621791 [Trichonephila clavipes]
MRDCGFVTATVTGERHADMLQNRIIPSLADKHLLERTIFMQGGAPPHIARRVKDLLRRSFESNSTVPKNSADEKNCADGAKLCTNETEPSARARSPNNKCLCVKRLWPMRRRVNLTSVLRIGITGHAPMTGFTECSLLSNC